MSVDTTRGLRVQCHPIRLLHLRTLRRDRPYERLTITGIQGLTQAEIATLRALGAIEDAAAESP